MIRIPFLRCGAVFAGFIVFITSLISLTAQPITSGNMISLDGTTNSYALVTNFTGFPSNAWTAEFWMRSTNTGFAGVFSYANNQSDNEIMFYRPTNLTIWVNGTESSAVGNIADGRWHHVAASWTNNGILKVYLDGALTLTQTNIRGGHVMNSGGTLLFGQDQDVMGGGFDPTQSYAGDIDEVRLWDRVRNDSEIQTNRYRPLVSNTTGLVAYYRFDEGFSLSVLNAVANTNNGTVVGPVSRGESGVPFVPVLIATNATSVTPTSAVLSATVYPNNVPTGGRFEWGLVTTPYTFTNHFGLLGSNNASVTPTLSLTNLNKGSTYHYRFVLTNSLATNIASDQYFIAGIFSITNKADDGGPGTLRWATRSAGDGSVISFALTGVFSLTNGPLQLAGGVTLKGPGTSTYLNANGSSRILEVAPGNTVTISDLVLTNGHAPNAFFSSLFTLVPASHGGAIQNSGNLVLSNCIVIGCSAGAGTSSFIGAAGGNGGAIENTGNATIIGCSFLNNFGGAGGSTGIAATDGGSGGAIFNWGTLSLYNCSFVGNSAGNGGSGFGSQGGDGGSGGAIFNNGILTATQCTVSSNRVGFGGTASGGTAGINGVSVVYNASSGTALLRSCTVVSNRVSGCLLNDGGTTNFIVHNTIVATNEAADLSGSFVSLGHNLIGVSDGGAGFINGINGDLVGTSASPIDAMMAPMVLSGGTILYTHSLFAYSPAVDAGDDTLIYLGTDQRGGPRQLYDHVDIGAIERNGLPPISAATLGATVSADPVQGGSIVSFNASVRSGSLEAYVQFEYGLTTAYGGTTPFTMIAQNSNTVNFSVSVPGFGEGYTFHYRVVATNSVKTVFGQDQTVFVPYKSIPGDLNHDGVVGPEEFSAVVTNYVSSTPWLQITNTVGLGTTNVSFAVGTNVGTIYAVEVSTNLTEWTPLGPALPRFEFADTNAVDNVQRYYRLRVQ